MFTVGPVQENAYIATAGRESGRAVMVDPGEEPERLLAAAQALGVQIEAILITHCHFDHIGAVAPVARATGAPVYCPKIEVPLLSDIMSWVPPGYGPFEGWEPEHTVGGGEHLTLAGLEVEVLFTPGHSPGHVTYALTPATDSPPEDSSPEDSSPEDSPFEGTMPALLSGDVLFQGSVGRVDLPGGDWSVLERSIATLLERFPGETMVYPGHMGVTSLGRELQTNPFLRELRASLGEGAATLEAGAGRRASEAPAASAPGR
jgi:hydroxyacylglutathione hydrolase